jgi:filamentous hemagglutinin family protein
MTQMFALPHFAAPHRGRFASTTALTGGVLSGLLVFVAGPVPAAAQNALPTSGVVASGAASMGTSAGALTINQTSARAVINWQGFSVGQGNSVTFVQPDANSAALNRVTGTTSSTIAGSIGANGQVFLVNPNGIAVTPTGSVNAGGGFVGSTLDIADRDFNAGTLNFRGGGASSGVANQGAITTGSGGFVGLLGGTVSNTGTIDVPLGRVGLASG